MSKVFIYWLKHNQSTKDKKWVYSLIAWVLEHKHEKKERINRHVNTILHHNKGYFEKYKDKKDKAYWKKYYKQHSKKIRDSSRETDKRIRTIYHLYNNGLLSEESTKTINKELIRRMKK